MNTENGRTRERERGNTRTFTHSCSPDDRGFSVFFFFFFSMAEYDPHTYNGILLRVDETSYVLDTIGDSAPIVPHERLRLRLGS
jgi:hypothetical protein